MSRGFYVREQKYICGKGYATALTMQADFFEVTDTEHKATTRKKRELATSMAKEAYNMKESRRYLVLLLNTNFRPGDFSVTFTYDSEHHPAPDDFARADKDFTNAKNRLYRLCDKKGIERPKWVVVSEYCTTDQETGKVLGRHHHHVALQHTIGLTREMVEQIWKMGLVRCEPLHFDHGSIESLAMYITKNKRCKRHWRQSRGLQEPLMPRPNDSKVSRSKLKLMCENCLEDRDFWEKMYPGYTLHRCDVAITGNNTRHLIVNLYRKDLISVTGNRRI